MKKAEWKKTINNLHAKIFSDDLKREIFLALLGRGYFPRQLPPPFSTQSFERFASHNADDFEDVLIRELHLGRTRIKTAHMCRYSLARPGQLRRVLSMPNPAFHYLLSLKLADAFDLFEFENDFLSMGYSMSFPKFEHDKRNRAFEFSQGWDRIPLRRLRERAKGRFLVKTDIARFFPSIYTHSIPWALHGKKKAKQDRSSGLDGNFIDTLVRNTQDGQTLGIPIGPDTSFLISERILLEIDHQIYKQIKDRPIYCFHWVDDYEFVCLRREDAEFCLSVIQQALQTYELELNTLKTEIIELPEHLQEPEVAQLRNFSFDEEPNIHQLLEYYDLAYACYKKHPQGTLKYAIKRLPEENFYDETISDFMVQSMMLEPGVIEAVFVWLARTERIDFVDKEMFVQCLSQIIKEHGLLGHTSEVAWAIWGFLLLKQKIPHDACEIICGMKDSVVLLLALDAQEKGLIDSKALAEQVSKIVDAESLYGPHWLLSYEAAVHDWGPKAHVEQDPIFETMKSADVYFYQSKDIEEYKTIMRDWEPYNPYVDDFDEILAPEEDEDSLF